MLKWIALCTCLFVSLPVFLWERVLEVGWLGQRVNAYGILLDAAKFPCIGVIPFCIPIIKLWEYLFPKVLPINMMSKFWGFANMIGEKLHLTAVLICISLMMKKVEHFFHMSKSNLHLFFNELSDYTSSENFYRLLVFFFSIFRGCLICKL